MSEEIEITLSPLCRSYTEGDMTVEVEIYSGNQTDWVLELISDEKTIILENTFPSEAAAYGAFEALVEQCGLKGLVQS
ncbi:MAG: hypothetical protein NXH95_06040 [Pseudomonadaceae bacterium]|nr:hypothetical protein [Pseudomonadaceae bacterium]